MDVCEPRLPSVMLTRILHVQKEIDQIQRGAMEFLLYDDGWRIVER